MVFYGAQIFWTTLPSGYEIGINSLPTIYFAILGDDSATPTRLNVVALIMFSFSVLLWLAFRNGHKGRNQLPPDDSLEQAPEE